MTVNIINEYAKSFSSDDVANGSTISKRVFAANRLFMTAGLAVLIAVGGISACSVQETDKAKHATSQSKENSSDQPPKFEQNEGYVSVRQKMIGAGWSPYHSPSADVCGEGDVRCKDRPEMEACAGSGMANCRFLWKNGKNTIAILTVGEDTTLSGYEPVASDNLSQAATADAISKTTGAEKTVTFQPYDERGPKKHQFYLDDSSIVHEGNIATAITLDNVSEPEELGEGKSYQSHMQKVRVDCDNSRLQILRSWYKSGEHMMGANVYMSDTPGETSKMPEGSTGSALVKLVCFSRDELQSVRKKVREAAAQGLKILTTPVILNYDGIYGNDAWNVSFGHSFQMTIEEERRQEELRTGAEVERRKSIKK